MLLAGEVIAARTMNGLYIVFDIIFLCILMGILLWTKRYQAAIVGLLGGVLYFLVDYGIFYLALGTRVVTGADPFWFLLWLSMSYGFTNFVWIWVWLDRARARVVAADRVGLAVRVAAQPEFRPGFFHHQHFPRHGGLSRRHGAAAVCGVWPADCA